MEVAKMGGDMPEATCNASSDLCFGQEHIMLEQREEKESTHVTKGLND